MTDIKELREVLAQGLTEAGKNDDRICVVEADLMSCHKTKCFQQAFPERFVNVGIAEANMIGVSAGMAAMGKIPFAYSFAPFATRRCYDQIFISVAYSKLPVKIVGTDPGVTAEANGGTHMPFEDMSLMRAIPNMVCFEPTDATMLEKAIPQIIDYPGAVYVRMYRKKAEQVFDSSLEFKLGKAITIKEGTDVTLIASGIEVDRALKASEILAEDGISAEVINIHTWKPIDKEAVIATAQKTGAIVTCENHSVYGGLYSAVSEVCAEFSPVPMAKVGVDNQFGEVGKNDYLSHVFRITTEDIVSKAKAVIAKK